MASASSGSPQCTSGQVGTLGERYDRRTGARGQDDALPPPSGSSTVPSDEEAVGFCLHEAVPSSYRSLGVPRSRRGLGATTGAAGMSRENGAKSGIACGRCEPDVAWRWRRCSRRTSGSARRRPSWNVTWLRWRPIRGHASWPVGSWPPSSKTGSRSTFESRRRHPSTRWSSWPGWTVRCSVVPWVRCYIR